MMVRSINTREYDADIGKLMQRKIDESSDGLRLCVLETDSATAEIRDDTDFYAWCRAVSRLLNRDLSCFEIARMVDSLPLSLLEKQQILPESLKNLRSSEKVFGLERALREYFQSEEKLNLEGFMRFRMQDILSSWSLCVDHAAEELLIKRESYELMKFIGKFVSLQAPRIKEVSLCFNPDGSCILTDDNDVRIEYSACTDGLIGVLVGLAPEQIMVYDLSGGQNEELNSALRDVFAGKIRFYQ